MREGESDEMIAFLSESCIFPAYASISTACLDVCMFGCLDVWSDFMMILKRFPRNEKAPQLLVSCYYQILLRQLG